MKCGFKIGLIHYGIKYMIFINNVFIMIKFGQVGIENVAQFNE